VTAVIVSSALFADIAPILFYLQACNVGWAVPVSVVRPGSARTAFYGFPSGDEEGIFLPKRGIWIETITVSIWLVDTKVRPFYGFTAFDEEYSSRPSGGNHGILTISIS